MKNTALSSQQEALNKLVRSTPSNFDVFIILRLNEISKLEESLSRIVAYPPLVSE